MKININKSKIIMTGGESGQDTKMSSGHALFWVNNVGCKLLLEVDSCSSIRHSCIKDTVHLSAAVCEPSCRQSDSTLSLSVIILLWCCCQVLLLGRPVQTGRQCLCSCDILEL